MHLNLIRRRGSSGFSLLEVLVTMVIMALGFLGLAKMQASAVSSTQVSRVRSLIALQAASLGSSMRSNRAYWAATPAPTFTAAGGVITEATSVLTNTTNCAGTAPCTAAQTAAFDVRTWAAALNARFPTATAAVNCVSATAGAPGVPATCRIVMSWSEQFVAINRSTAAASAALTANQTFTLYVTP